MLKNRWFVAVVVSAGLTIPAFGQDVELKWKFEKGKTFYQEVTTKTEQKITVMQMPVTQNQEQTFYFSWTPKEQDKDKNWIVEQKIIGLKMNIDIGGNKIGFDSTKDTTTSNPLSDFFKALVDSKFDLTISPDFKVTAINTKDKEDFLKKLTSANPQMEGMLKQILSDDALKQMADPAFAIVPEKKVKKGDNWSKTSNLSLGPIGSYETTYTYTADGQDDKDKKIYKIKVATKLSYVPPSETGGAGLPFKIKDAKLDSKNATGEVRFDTEKGRVESSTMSQGLEGKLTIEVGGTSSEVELKQTQTTTVKTSDTNPIAEKKAA